MLPRRVRKRFHKKGEGWGFLLRRLLQREHLSNGTSEWISATSYHQVMGQFEKDTRVWDDSTTTEVQQCGGMLVRSFPALFQREGGVYSTHLGSILQIAPYVI